MSVKLFKKVIDRAPVGDDVKLVGFNMPEVIDAVHKQGNVHSDDEAIEAFFAYLQKQPRLQDDPRDDYDTVMVMKDTGDELHTMMIVVDGEVTA